MYSSKPMWDSLLLTSPSQSEGGGDNKGGFLSLRVSSHGTSHMWQPQLSSHFFASSTEPWTWTLCDSSPHCLCRAQGLTQGVLADCWATINSLKDHLLKFNPKAPLLELSSFSINKYILNTFKYSSSISTRFPFRKWLFFFSCGFCKEVHLLSHVVFLYGLRNPSLPEDHPWTSPAPPTNRQAKACLLNTEPFYLLARKPNLPCYLRWITPAKIEPTESSSQGGGWQRWGRWAHFEAWNFPGSGHFIRRLLDVFFSLKTQMKAQRIYQLQWNILYHQELCCPLIVNKHVSWSSKCLFIF